MADDVTAGPEQITNLLKAWERGDESALERLTPIVYAQLRRIARSQMRNEASGHTLQTTALVHEAYIRLMEGQEVQWQSRAHFYAVCATLMRRILVDEARKRAAARRGGEAQRIVSPGLKLDQLPDVGPARDAEIVALNDALDTLAAIDPRKARVVELRFFGGLSAEESAVVLGVSPQTVRRDWSLARAWLNRELTR
ncbi:MAG TPA: sigma-70 family RNA polymerase sigma factor [Bryobacteraceae bacterium]|nr:sigma-70 family RNA polymerase sigma factor [Bryobacteraceae bacterium]